MRSADLPTHVQLLPAQVEDLPAIAALAEVIWRQHYPGIISTAQIDYMLERMYSLDTLRTEIQSGGVNYERLMVEAQMVGFAAYGPTAEPGVMKLHKLYLLPSLHGQGYGSRLLQHCEDRAVRIGAKRLILAVNKANTKAIAAYRRNGYTVQEAVVTDIGGGFVMDDFILGKTLTKQNGR